MKIFLRIGAVLFWVAYASFAQDQNGIDKCTSVPASKLDTCCSLSPAEQPDNPELYIPLLIQKPLMNPETNRLVQYTPWSVAGMTFMNISSRYLLSSNTMFNQFTYRYSLINFEPGDILETPVTQETNTFEYASSAVSLNALFTIYPKKVYGEIGYTSSKHTNKRTIDRTSIPEQYPISGTLKQTVHQKSAIYAFSLYAKMTNYLSIGISGNQLTVDYENYSDESTQWVTIYDYQIFYLSTAIGLSLYDICKNEA